mmetsp:Transcript_6142/g.17143  ORF Transcript_6142/g.17143 Transcript_6142/m.17143 type:complete len:465 (+) Transcript_6142:178-1572(+)
MALVPMGRPQSWQRVPSSMTTSFTCSSMSSFFALTSCTRRSCRVTCWRRCSDHVWRSDFRRNSSMRRTGRFGATSCSSRMALVGSTRLKYCSMRRNALSSAALSIVARLASASSSRCTATRSRYTSRSRASGWAWPAPDALAVLLRELLLLDLLYVDAQHLAVPPEAAEQQRLLAVEPLGQELHYGLRVVGARLAQQPLQFALVEHREAGVAALALRDEPVAEDVGELVVQARRPRERRPPRRVLRAQLRRVAVQELAVDDALDVTHGERRRVHERQVLGRERRAVRERARVHGRRDRLEEGHDLHVVQRQGALVGAARLPGARQEHLHAELGVRLDEGLKLRQERRQRHLDLAIGHVVPEVAQVSGHPPVELAQVPAAAGAALGAGPHAVRLREHAQRQLVRAAGAVEPEQRLCAGLALRREHRRAVVDVGEIVAPQELHQALAPLQRVAGQVRQHERAVDEA